MCGCTDLGHDDVRRLIVAQELEDHSRPDAGAGMDDVVRLREVPSGAELLSARDVARRIPGRQPVALHQRARARQYPEGRHIFGRAAHVGRHDQRQGIARDRRRGREVRHSQPSKCTGGQRIDMLGVKKEDLPAVWADLNKAGMVSGAAYAKGLRTVKTCVGTDWCRFGTQDSTGLGIKLEKFLWGSWTPAKVKLAVSGCPRNCAEATCKDIGVICVDSGYDIHFAGAAGLDIKGTEVLGHVDTEDEAIEVIAALDAALSRAGPLSRTHLQMGEARRSRHHPTADHADDRRSARRCTSASSIRRQFVADRIRGPSALPARMRTSSRRWPTLPVRRPRNDRRKAGWVDIGASATFRCAARASVKTAAAASPSSAPARAKSSPSRTVPAQGRAAEPGHRARQVRHVSAAQLGDQRSKTGRRRARTKGAVRTFPLQVEDGRILLDLASCFATKAARRCMQRHATRSSTTCPYCGVGCGVVAKRGGLVKVGDSQGIRIIRPIAGGCAPKGQRSAKRWRWTVACSIPMVDGQRASWDDALERRRAAFLRR